MISRTFSVKKLFWAQFKKLFPFGFGISLMSAEWQLFFGIQCFWLRTFVVFQFLFELWKTFSKRSSYQSRVWNTLQKFCLDGHGHNLVRVWAAVDSLHICMFTIFFVDFHYFGFRRLSTRVHVRWVKFYFFVFDCLFSLESVFLASVWCPFFLYFSILTFPWMVLCFHFSFECRRCYLHSGLLCPLITLFEFVYI